MKLRCNFASCIICTSNAPNSWEHIIPRFIGGRLEANLLCDTCNRKFGAKIVASLKHDPSIRLALENVRQEVPRIYKEARKGWLYTAPGVDGKAIKIKADRHRDRVLTRKADDGSLLVDTREARRTLRKILENQGYTSRAIADYLHAFDVAAEHELIEVPGGLLAVKRPYETMSPHLKGQLVDERLPILIAVEFLALTIGNNIFEPYFNPVRSFIKGGPRPSNVTCERLRSGHYGAFHRIYCEAPFSGLEVYVCFFRYLVFRVKFHRACVGGPVPVYLEDIKTARSLFAESLQDAKKGSFFLLNPRKDKK